MNKNHTKLFKVSATVSLRSESEIISSWKEGPLVSICCVTYNHENYIKNALEGFLIQKTSFPFEILVHDDASSDRTRDVVDNFKLRYPNIIKTIYQDRNQFSKFGFIAIRFLFPVARGKYIALCEGDDFWVDPDKIQKQVSFLDSHEEYVITYSDCVPFDESGVLQFSTGGATRDLCARELQRGTPINTLTTCFRNVLSFLPKNLHSAKLGDITYWSLLGKYGKGKYIPEIIPSCYRVHHGGIFSKKSKQQRRLMNLSTEFSLARYHFSEFNFLISAYFFWKSLKSLIVVLVMKGGSSLGGFDGK